jgi:hypothetical protein
MNLINPQAIIENAIYDNYEIKPKTINEMSDRNVDMLLRDYQINNNANYISNEKNLIDNLKIRNHNVDNSIKETFDMSKLNDNTKTLLLIIAILIIIIIFMYCKISSLKTQNYILSTIIFPFPKRLFKKE